MPTWDEITPDTERWTRPKLTGTNALLIANILGFILSGILPAVFSIQILSACFTLDEGIRKFWLWQFVTHHFVQPITPIFLLFFIVNGYLMYLWGNELERDLGLRRYLLLYFGSGAYAALTHAIYQVVSNSVVPTFSFLAPTFAIFTVYAWRYPTRTVLFMFMIPMRVRTMILLSGAITLFYCIVEFKIGLSPVAILGAFVFALLFHKLEPKIDAWLEASEAKRERDRLIGEVELRHKVDQILEKISREGMGALTRQERAILKKASQGMANERGVRND